MADLAPRTVVAGYRVDSLLGRGGMGAVYRATQLALQRPVALKVIAAPFTSDRAFRERFHREARAIRADGRGRVRRA
jgi:serine/threonine protein kinase